jgi:hypothetical protein
MLMSSKDAFDMLSKFKLERPPLVAIVELAPKEKHAFEASVGRFSESELVLSGEHAVVSVPLEPSGEWTYSDAREAPPEMRAFLSAAMECSLSMRSKSVRLVLFLMKFDALP